MSRRPGFRALDKDLGRLAHTEMAQLHAIRPVLRLGLGMLALIGTLMVAMALSGAAPGVLALGAGLVVAAWLGIAIGANDVANSLGPAFGAGAIRLLPGLALVAVAGITGAVLAGGAVSARLAQGIVELGDVAQGARAPMVMVAALIGAASWITLATAGSLPVSTSHSIVGGIAGAGALAFGPGSVAWGTVAMIASVWVATPILSGALAGALLILLRRKVVDAADRAQGAQRWLPPLVGLMSGAFAGYVMILLQGSAMATAAVTLVLGLGGLLVTRQGVRRELARDPDKPATRRLLRPAVLLAVAILGFAHGANDVGNIAGPLSVILQGQSVAPGLSLGPGVVPVLVLVCGGLAIATGTLLFGRRVVHMVGSGITRLNAWRAFCVSLATAIVVMGASGLGLPVSTTHVAVGGVFGVGFAREWLDHRRETRAEALPAEETRRRILVRRSHVVTITAAWLVTLPITASLGALACLLLLWATGV
ncbi:inorganic phosphate transporter [Paracoccus liaowanqingii]|uniref:Phosphate transporter n=1 Tax=Paracoccus liaowanqingii TaxID=2560053 RepID=A0A4V1BJC2_9RHOB|nr:inorganic phosphate transporter [Paracoccus liaowanqingii]QBX35782.1 inorganic phosphate transporter [Paracoccus liaowanqingii]